jgi:tetratricopeptide (TPR) repeat protein
VIRSAFLLACAAAIALVIAAYANSLDNVFHFDDSHVVEQNLFIRSLSNVPRFFTDANTFSSLPQNATYRPLVTLSLAVDHAIGGGLAPRAFHRTQIALLLILGAMLVAFFTPILRSQWGALFAATLFCVHTANTETMNLISARSELLSTIGLLGSFLLYQRSPFARRTFLYLVPLAIGALAKAPLVVFAPLLYFYVRLFEQQPPKRALRIIAPSLVLGIALLLFLNSMNSPQWTSGGGSAFHYAITQPFVWLHYARLFILPLGLTADTDWRPFTEWYDTRAIAGYAFIALLIFATRRASRPVAFGLWWFVIALLPTSSFFPLAEVANEHRIFFAYIGLVLAVAYWLLQLVRARTILRNAAIAVALSVLVLHAIGTHERNEIWATETSLWRDVVEKSPANGRAWMNYGLSHMARGDYNAAKTAFDRAALLNPNYSVLEINQGIVLGVIGKQEEAERHFRRALELDPSANAHYYYARWLVERGRAPQALEHLRSALRLSPAFGEVRTLLMRVLSAAGRDAELRAIAQDTLRIDSTNAVARAYASGQPPFDGVAATYDAYFNHSLAALQRGDHATAAEACRHALRFAPRSADAYNNLGWSLFKLGFHDEAARAYEQALAIDPRYDRARSNLQWLRSSQTQAVQSGR